jgi:DNA replication protein DnaC
MQRNGSCHSFLSNIERAVMNQKDFDCRPELTKDILERAQRRRNIVVTASYGIGKTTLLQNIKKKLSGMEHTGTSVIDLSKVRKKPKVLQQIAFSLKYTKEFNPADGVKIKSSISEEEILEYLDYIEGNILLIIDDLHRFSSETVLFIKQLAEKKKVFFLASASYSRHKNVEELCSKNVVHIRMIESVKNKILKKYFEHLLEDIKEKLGEKNYNIIKSKAVRAANGSPGVLVKLVDDIKSNENENFEKLLINLEEAIGQIEKRYVYLKPYMIILPIMGFAVAFCMARFEINLVRTVFGTIFAGVCLSLYRILVGWAEPVKRM